MFITMFFCKVLLLEEGLETMRRNEEMMREENSRFQKEIDDKQAESKEVKMR